MSASNLQPRELKSVVCKEGVIDFTEELYVVEKGAATNQSFPVVSTNYSTSSTSFSVNINSRDAIVDRCFIIKQPVTIDITTLNPVLTPPPVQAPVDILSRDLYAFRSYPVNSMINSITLQAGNVTVTSLISDLLPFYERAFTHGEDKYTSNGLSITQQEQFKYYDNGLQSSRDSLAGYPNVGFDNNVSRGSHPVRLSQVGALPLNRGVRVSSTLIEPLWLSPLITSLKEKAIGFTHLTQITITINWNANAQRMFSFYNGQIQAGNTVTYTHQWGQPEIQLTQYTDSLIIPPAVVSYNFSDAQRFTTDFLVNQAGANNPNYTIQQVTTQTIQLSSIPKYLAVYAMPNWNEFKWNTTRHFLPITGIQVLFNNQTYCSSMTEEQIYSASVQNGLDMNYRQWSGIANNNGNQAYLPTVGSVVLFKFGAQIPLPSQLSVGCSVKCNLSATVNLYNNDQQLIPITNINGYTLYMALVYDSVISLFGSNSGSITNAPLTEVDVLQAQKENPVVNYTENSNPFGSYGLGKNSNYVVSGRLSRHMNKMNKSNDSKYQNAVRDAMSEDMGAGLVNRESFYVGQGRTGGKKMSRAMMKKHLLG